MRGRSPAKLVLVDGDTAITLRPAVVRSDDPIICRSWDLGAPEVRAGAADLDLADGTVDSSAFTGSRTVTFDLVIRSDKAWTGYTWVEKLTAMAHPSRRPVLQATRSTPEHGGLTYEMQLRGNPFSITYGRRAAALLELQLSFTAPLGYLEGPNQVYTTTNATGAAVTTGVTLPTSFPFTTGTAAAENPLVEFRVGGSAPVYPVIYIYGPTTDPEVVDDAGNSFRFNNLTLATGQYAQIDMATATVLRDATPTASLYNAVDWMVSSFWRWQPGRHSVRLFAGSGRAAVHFRDRRFTI